MKVAVYRTSSAGCKIIYCLLTKKGYDAQYVDRWDVEAGRLRYFGAAVFPGAYQHIFAFMRSQDFRVELRRYVRGGGRFVGVCGGALLGIWLVDGFWRNALPNLQNGLYYGWYMLSGTFGRFIIEWRPDNLFGEVGSQLICWAGGPALSRSFRPEALYGEDKLFLPFRGKKAVGIAKYGNGTVILFGPHPEYLVNGKDNTHLLLKAVED